MDLLDTRLALLVVLGARSILFCELVRDPSLSWSPRPPRDMLTSPSLRAEMEMFSLAGSMTLMPLIVILISELDLLDLPPALEELLVWWLR